MHLHHSVNVGDQSLCSIDVLSLDVLPTNASTRNAAICTQANVLDGTERPRSTRSVDHECDSHRCIQTCPEVRESNPSCRLRRQVHMPVRVAAPIQRAPVIDGWTTRLESLSGGVHLSMTAGEQLRCARRRGHPGWCLSWTWLQERFKTNSPQNRTAVQLSPRD